MGIRTEDKIKRIIIHCTASDDSLDIGFKEVNQWHADRGWLSPSGISCGYHYVVRRDGTVEDGRPVTEMGAGARGHNDDTIHIVWVGLNAVNKVQYDNLLYLTNALRYRYNILPTEVFGHCELPGVAKTCPNLNMTYFRANLLFAGRS